MEEIQVGEDEMVEPKDFGFVIQGTDQDKQELTPSEEIKEAEQHQATVDQLH